MKTITPSDSWPTSWKQAYAYDVQEVFGEVTSHGYVYAYENRRQRVLALVEECVGKNSRIIDVAAAQGNFTLALAERGYRVTWNDLREELAGYVELKHDKGMIDYLGGDLFTVGHSDLYDCVLATEIIEHVAHPDEFLCRLASLVRPGGYIVMSTPNGAYARNGLPRFSDCADPSEYEAVQFQPNSDGHIFLLWPDEIQSLAAGAGLTVDKVELFTTPLTAGHMKLHLLLKILPKWLVFGFEGVARALPLGIRQRLMAHTAVRYRKE